MAETGSRWLVPQTGLGFGGCLGHRVAEEKGVQLWGACAWEAVLKGGGSQVESDQLDRVLG